MFSSILMVLLLTSQSIKQSEGSSASSSWSAGSSSDLRWNLPRPVVGYKSYNNVFPTRYDIPAGLSNVVWMFQTLRTSSCGNVTVDFMIQHGGLPLVNESRQSFPDNYYIPRSSLLSFALPAGQAFSFSLARPPAGPFYVIAFSKAKAGGNKIHQKGLPGGDACIVNYISSLQLGSEIPRRQVTLLDRHPITISQPRFIISFVLPSSSFGFQVKISDCSRPNCTINVLYKPFAVNTEQSQDCEDVDTTECVFSVSSPPLSDEQHVYLFPKSEGQAVYLQLQVVPLTCKTYFPDGLCATLPQLVRINTVRPNIAQLGYITRTSRPVSLQFGRYRTLVVPFGMVEPNDIGATLVWKLSISDIRVVLKGPIYRASKDIVIRVCGGLVYNQLPDVSRDDFDACTNLSQPVRVQILGTEKNESTVYVPYPRVGVWHAIAQASCYMASTGSKVPCPAHTSVDMSFNIRPCIDSGCGGRGECLSKTIGSDLVSFSACHCYAGYRGYGCNDDTEALSKSVQLAGAFLLTMSNFLFIPCIVVAVRRKFFIEAFVYSYTMFFSTFYHACDGDRINQYRVCIMDFDTLQSADFFGSSCSLWFTLVAMAMIRCRYVTPILQTMGPLGLFIGVVYDKTSLYVIAVPIIAGLVIIIASWSVKMYRRRQLYPSKKRYLFFLLPGVVLASVAAGIYIFIETQENYKYLHSLWHVSIALSVCFLLPPRPASHQKDIKDCMSMTTPLTQINSGDDTLSIHSTHE